MKATKADKRVEHLEPELEKMEEKYSREKDRLGKIFNIATELDDDLKLAVTEMKARDDWYVSHMTLFEDLNKAIKERYEMIERAVESERKSQHMGRAIEDRVEEMVTARAAEMTIDEAEGSASDAKTEETESSSDNQPVTEEPATESEDAPEESTTESTETAKEPEPTPATTTWADDEDPWADN
jgi:septal ring factor EnvC (AmiA/AmiB activator)